METLADFCDGLGIIMDKQPSEGLWTRYKTKSRRGGLNGAVKLIGGIALVQNWEDMGSPAVWRDGEKAMDGAAMALTRQSSEEDRKKLQEIAAAKAKFIVDASPMEIGHPYMAKKGFPNVKVMINQGCVVVPTWANRKLVGCQRINEKGEKRFLYGQITKGSGYRIGRGDMVILCEGYATALTVSRVSHLLKWDTSIIACLSAMNLKHVASVIGSRRNRFVVADNDKSGVGAECAKETGWPSLVPGEEGEDFNDMWIRCGDYEAREVLRLFEVNLQEMRK